jgi:acyltransferase
MQTERVHWIDIARGIGIIFVIYGHVLGSNGFRYLIYAFHMPLFFFLSGAVFNDKKYLDFKQYVKKNIKSILIPYFIFGFLMFFLWLIGLNTFYLLSHQVLKQFFSIFYANSNNGLLVFNDVLWFLPVLFVTKVIFGFLQNNIKKAKLIFIVLVLFSVFGYLISIIIPFLKLPFGAESAITAVAFYGMGYLWFRFENAKNVVYKYKYILFPALLVFGSVLANIDFNNYGHQIDIRLNNLNNYFFFYIAAFSGIFTWISLSIILNKNFFLEKLGRNSLILFVWHPIVFTYLALLLKAVLATSVLKSIKNFIPLIYTTISIITILLTNFFFNKLKLNLQRKLI